jgi:hypothetical protein
MLIMGSLFYSHCGTFTSAALVEKSKIGSQARWSARFSTGDFIELTFGATYNYIPVFVTYLRYRATRQVIITKKKSMSRKT